MLKKLSTPKIPASQTALGGAPKSDQIPINSAKSAVITERLDGVTDPASVPANTTHYNSYGALTKTTVKHEGVSTITPVKLGRK